MSNVLDSGPDQAVFVVIVNWNGWRDTITCLQSLLELADYPMRVAVCDNGSTDDSMDRLTGWLRDRFELSGGDFSLLVIEGSSASFENSRRRGALASVHLIPLAFNYGYAGAINRGIAWGREHFGSSTFWLLNNDVQVCPGALSSLVSVKKVVPQAGLCGSVLLDWGRPAQIQAIGGIYSRALAVGRHLRSVPHGVQADADVYLGVDYPVGASLLVSQDYLDKVGSMDESYFLYYEEMDWVQRGRRHGFRPVIALKSRMFHKEGASTGSHGGVRSMSMLSEHYGAVNRLRITRKFWPALLPVVWISLGAVVMDRLVHGEHARAGLLLRLMFSPSLWLRDT